MRKMRNLHLWIGLISSIFLLVEAVTGLLLSEPWLIGQTERGEMHRAVQEGMSSFGTGAGASTAPMAPRAEGGGSSLMMFVRQLHEGRLGSLDIRWAVDVAAVAMIVLTATGIFLPIRTLAAGRKRKQKRMTPASETT
ncbi:PepSY-associated TM helix domain-containing protein [Geobacillus jurassicus]|uniref:PepSY-associated TM helix domain-containing protein n=1 Tax=Geobacillus jurassicus TaxID=235932 RepID=A0ABV6GQW0_9BACL|nr:PepSY-associated TM helix domain-containing protein [Geobacillus jurassicus]